MSTRIIVLSVFTGIGAITLASALFKICSFVIFHFVPCDSSLKKYQRAPRAWAIATGSSAGIGFGHLQELTARGFGVIVLAHKEGEVREAAQKIKAEFKDAAVEQIVLDVTKATYEDVQLALKPYMELPITVLVNNASVQTSVPTFTYFESYKPDDIHRSIFANNEFLCNITHILYPVLKSNGPSLIINVSSGAHSIGLPWLTIYSGTKAFTESFSRAVSREAKEQGDRIDSITIIPGDVATPGNVHGVSPGSPDGRQFAKMALDRIARAVAWDRKVFVPYWQHDIQIALSKTLPDSIVAPAAIADIAHRRELELKAN